MTLQQILIFAGIVLVASVVNIILWRNVSRQIYEIHSHLKQNSLATIERVFPELEETELWFTTRCETCKHEVTFDDPIEPGQVSVVRCPQCGDAWAAVLPSVYIVKADQLELKQEQLIREV